MDWKKLINELRDAGLQQSDISCLTGISQSTISELKNIKNKDPSWTTGDKLVQLRNRRWQNVINQLLESGMTINEIFLSTKIGTSKLLKLRDGIRYELSLVKGDKLVKLRDSIQKNQNQQKRIAASLGNAGESPR
jgi:predicted XRE-type DNA-binding protein